MTRPLHAVLALALLAATACGGLTPPKPEKTDAIIHFNSKVKDAEVWVNGRPIREIRELRGGMALSPGTHLIEIRHDRYHTHYLRLKVEKRERRTITVKLAEKLP